ncbi:MAG TPA: MarR family transcriptional regulator [Kineosporiaceae bacterium]|nr:MarR family transcriptional regulator [Kineosporiaceae bacterium]
MNPSTEAARTRRRFRPGNPASLLYLVKQLELAVTAEMERVTSIATLTPVQYTALTTLERHPGITSAQLARTSFVRAQSMAELVNTLMRRGLISRERDPRDGRHYLLSLTPEGAALVESLSGPVSTIERLMLADLEPEEIEQLRRHLDRCRRALAVTDPGGPGRSRR